MSGGAKVTSVEALNALKPALVKFAQEVADALVSLDLECRRPTDWIERNRALYWPNEVRKASDAVAEARSALLRAESNISDESRWAYQERKMLEKAKRRLQLCEEKVEAVRRWKVRMRKEVEDFQVNTARLKHFMDSDFVRALASLERMLAAIEQYLNTGGSDTGSGGQGAGA